MFCFQRRTKTRTGHNKPEGAEEKEKKKKRKKKRQEREIIVASVGEMRLGSPTIQAKDEIYL